MRKDSLSKNFIYQLIYQIIILVIPLILSPYLTRTLGKTALGTYTFVNSIAYYFVVIANLGISRHGQRIISTNSNDDKSLRRVFWSLFFLHILISLFVTLIYIVYINFFVTEDKIIYIIHICYVVSALFDITWLFYGLENFKSVVIKNAIIKILVCLLIFLFVHNPKDLWIYTLITTLGILIGQTVMIPQAIKLIKPIRFEWVDVSQHIKPLLIFSISVIASTLYTVFDKTLLGILAAKEDVAFYEYSNSIISVPKAIVGVIGTVMYPRACKMVINNDLLGQRRYIKYSFFFTSLIGIGSIFGLAGIAKSFAIIYFGKSFEICGVVMIFLSPLVYIIGMGDIIRTQYMIPNRMDIQYNFSIILNAIVNVLFSILLIPKIGIYGAIVGTILAEICGLSYQTYICRSFINFRDMFEPAIPFSIIGVLMFMVIKILTYIIPDSILGVFIQVSIGGLTYVIFTLLYSKIFNREIWLMLKEKTMAFVSRIKN